MAKVWHGYHSRYNVRVIQVTTTPVTYSRVTDVTTTPVTYFRVIEVTIIPVTYSDVPIH